nr:hypothetical protein [Planctomycetota bacterium]
MSRTTLHPYHDAHGELYPELDWRWVTAAVMIQYCACCHATLTKRANDGAFGRGEADGVRFVRGRAGQTRGRGHWEYRPGMIWQRRRLGRYGDAAFDWQKLHHRFPVYN